MCMFGFSFVTFQVRAPTSHASNRANPPQTAQHSNSNRHRPTAMPAPAIIKRPEVVQALRTPEDLEQWLQREKTLLVIDVHPGWCGPCSDVLDSFYRKIVQDVNSSSSSAGAGAGEETSGDGEGSGGPLQFLTADRQLLGAKLRALFFPSSSSSSTAKDQPAGTANSKPPVAVSAQFTMNGGSGGASNGSAGAAAVAALLESGGCQPLVLFAKGRQLVAAVQGIDTPAIAQLIQQHVGSSTS